MENKKENPKFGRCISNTCVEYLIGNTGKTAVITSNNVARRGISDVIHHGKQLPNNKKDCKFKKKNK